MYSRAVFSPAESDEGKVRWNCPVICVRRGGIVGEGLGEVVRELAGAHEHLPVLGRAVQELLLLGQGLGLVLGVGHSHKVPDRRRIMMTPTRFLTEEDKQGGGSGTYRPDTAWSGSRRTLACTPRNLACIILYCTVLKQCTALY